MRQRGFTLLEVLVVLVVTGLLLIGLTQAMRSGIDVWNRQARSVDAIGEMDSVDRVLRNLIEQMDPDARLDKPEVAGTNHWLRFTTELPAATTPLPTRRAEAVLLVDSMHHLLLRWRPKPYAELFVPAASVDTVLLSGVDHIDISYRSAADGWLPVWDGRTLPQLVRIHIDLASDKSLRWPDIIAAPMREWHGT
jgi:prepilin-type N-terminal cleavage/methylation domain-containing protein